MTIDIALTSFLPQSNNWWTVLSAGWLHGSLTHIAFNLVWLSILAPKVAKAFGSGRLTIICTFATIIGSLLTSLAGQVFAGVALLEGSQLSVGLSGAIFGLLGALVAYGQIMGSSSVEYQALVYATIMFTLGLIRPNVDNWGHFGGFIGGYLISWTSISDPRRREGIHHLFVALACLGLTVLSILTSIVHAVLFVKF